MSTEYVRQGVRRDPETAEKFYRMAELGKSFVETSGLQNDPETFTFKEVLEARKLLELMAPIDIKTAGFYQHVQLVPKVAREIALELDCGLNLDRVEITALFHDIGRFSTHSYNRNDLLADLLLKKIGVNQKVYQDIPEEDRFFGYKPDDDKSIMVILEKMSTIQKVIDLADFYGKRKSDGGILTFDEVMQYHFESRNKIKQKENLFPSERKLTTDLIDFSAKFMVKLKNWFLERGVDPDAIREKILKDERNSKIRAVIFDVGNVLIHNPDPNTLRDISDQFGIDPSELESYWNKILPILESGDMNTDDFWNKLFGKFEKSA